MGVPGSGLSSLVACKHRRAMMRPEIREGEGGCGAVAWWVGFAFVEREGAVETGRRGSANRRVGFVRSVLRARGLFVHRAGGQPGPARIRDGFGAVRLNADAATARGTDHPRTCQGKTEEARVRSAEAIAWQARYGDDHNAKRIEGRFRHVHALPRLVERNNVNFSGQSIAEN